MQQIKSRTTVFFNTMVAPSQPRVNINSINKNPNRVLRNKTNICPINNQNKQKQNAFSNNNQNKQQRQEYQQTINWQNQYVQNNTNNHKNMAQIYYQDYDLITVEQKQNELNGNCESKMKCDNPQGVQKRNEKIDQFKNIFNNENEMMPEIDKKDYDYFLIKQSVDQAFEPILLSQQFQLKHMATKSLKSLTPLISKTKLDNVYQILKERQRQKILEFNQSEYEIDQQQIVDNNFIEEQDQFDIMIQDNIEISDEEIRQRFERCMNRNMSPEQTEQLNEEIKEQFIEKLVTDFQRQKQFIIDQYEQKMGKEDQDLLQRDLRNYIHDHFDYKLELLQQIENLKIYYEELIQFMPQFIIDHQQEKNLKTKISKILQINKAFCTTLNDFIEDEEYQQKWKEIGPLKIWKLIEVERNIDLLLKDTYIQTIEIKNSLYAGQFSKNSDQANGANGINRQIIEFQGPDKPSYQIFEGFYKDGHPFGYGRLIQSDGSIVQGYWVDPRHQSAGKFEFFDGHYLKVIDQNSFYQQNQ